MSPREPWLREEFRLAGVPAMISRAEQRYLFWLTRTRWRDEGHVVEIGPWLGGSTLCLAEGMAASEQTPRHRLHVFDNFQWRTFMARFAALPLADGESFERYFRENTAAHRQRIVCHALNLPDEAIPGDSLAEAARGARAPELDQFCWDSGEPIEILFVDGAKSWRGIRALMRCVASSLLPGRSLLVCQDFKHWGSYWVPLLIARIRPKLELVHIVRRGSTATFRLLQPLSVASFEELVDDVARLDTPEALADIEAMARWIATTGDTLGAAHVRLGSVQLLSHQGHLSDALATFEELQASWPLRGSKGQLDDARRHLVARGLSPPPYRSWRRLLYAFGRSGDRRTPCLNSTDSAPGKPR